MGSNRFLWHLVASGQGLERMADPVHQNARWGILRALDGLLGPSAAVTHTHGSDLNELACAYFVNNERWWSPVAKALFAEKASLVVKATDSRDAVTVQVERGRAMGMKLRVHLAESRYSFRRVVWVARGNITDLVPHASANHPADLLLDVVYAGLPAGMWLGVSCKSRKGSEGSGLKNPGLNTIGQFLGIDLQRNVDQAVAIAVREWSLPETQKDRKAYLRTQPVVQALTRQRGEKILEGIRSTVFANLAESRIGEFVTDYLLDAGALVPPYIRVIGRGDQRHGYSAELINPSLMANYTGPWRMMRVGRDAVGFLSNGARICLLRAKFESEKLASTLKFSVDQWS